ncbi:ABC transporter substrate-binding protein [Clostridium algidicarnis]|uniref:ABC transporter substrate-binding protein n=1 Tax=Clostridium algidicarnis TaxID=37659 RepID=UPI001C0B3C0E|nr:ABC transporter substrate-binding protein [Clostridium algidicarnis]MBU3204177.1 ABC transporter substrate-binding protein [Clostridium algidicarnis]MBU3212331.1 ABC transporter substrate-binding protein [Clostridium algidicarnis]MBU3221164.1 ABC transporter substrate-binding protein [Clostridium algidicarnis]
MYRKTRRLMTVMLSLCLTLLLGACSNDVAKDNQTDISTSTRIYKDSEGQEVEIPANPKRIVLQGNSIGDLLALGIQPIGIDRRVIQDSVYLNKEQTPAKDIGFPTNLETVLSMDPDLIMLSWLMGNEYEEASKISPVVAFDGMLPLKERFPVIADIVGKKAEGEKLLEDYNRKAEAMWHDLRANGKMADGETAVILQYFWNKTMYLRKTDGLAELIYQPSGFSMDEKVKILQPNSGPYIEVSEEVMNDWIIGDRLFVLYSSNKDSEESFKQLLNTNLWKSLPAVKNGKVHFIEDKWNYNDMSTSDMLLDEFPNIIGR